MELNVIKALTHSKVKNCLLLKLLIKNNKKFKNGQCLLLPGTPCPHIKNKGDRRRGGEGNSNFKNFNLHSDVNGLCFYFIIAYIFSTDKV